MSYNVSSVEVAWCATTVSKLCEVETTTGVKKDTIFDYFIISYNNILYYMYMS